MHRGDPTIIVFANRLMILYRVLRKGRMCMRKKLILVCCFVIAIENDRTNSHGLFKRKFCHGHTKSFWHNASRNRNTSIAHLLVFPYCVSHRIRWWVALLCWKLYARPRWYWWTRTLARTLFGLRRKDAEVSFLEEKMSVDGCHGTSCSKSFMIYQCDGMQGGSHVTHSNLFPVRITLCDQ